MMNEKERLEVVKCLLEEKFDGTYEFRMEELEVDSPEWNVKTKPCILVESRCKPIRCCFYLEDEETCMDAYKRIYKDIRFKKTYKKVNKSFMALIKKYVKEYGSQEQAIEALKRDLGYDDIATAE